jgi:uncharacterized protein (TIGR02594 family)
MTLSAVAADASLKQGASGDVVRAVQLALRRLGYPLSGTAYFGPATDTAVEDFQRRYGMPVTGIVDATTARTIDRALKPDANDASAPYAPPEPLWLSVSLSHVGMKEAPGAKNNATLVDMIQTVAADYQTDATPWCAGWVSFCLAKAGLKPSRSPLWALSYAEGWGVRLAAPAVGAIAVKTRNGGGHVTFVAGRTRSGALACCGGNQNDRVSIAPYAATAFLGFFWPKDYPLPTMTGLTTLPVVDARGVALSEA